MYPEGRLVGFDTVLLEYLLLGISVSLLVYGLFWLGLQRGPTAVLQGKPHLARRGKQPNCGREEVDA
jgi:hypothetical protein